jgi:hypothetical protein
MILALAVILGLAVSLARNRGQTFGLLAGIPLRSAWLVVTALAMQFPLLRAPYGPTQQIGIQQALFLLSHLLLLVFVWRNRQLVGIQIIGLGILCNLLVILVNGGFMPITPETLVRINPGTTLKINPGTSLGLWQTGYHYGFSKDVILLRGSTNLWPLSDILVLPPPFPWPTAFSLGDLLIAGGIVVLLQGPIGWTRPVPAEACTS